MDFKGILSELRDKHKVESFIRNVNDLKVGTIIYVEMDRNDGLQLKGNYPTRLKYVVVAGCRSDHKEICAVLINSESDYSNDSDWRAEQYLLQHKNYPGILDYDSWIDCTDPKSLTFRKLKARKAEIKGCLTSEDLKAVMNILKKSDFINPHVKKIFGINSYIPE